MIGSRRFVVQLPGLSPGQGYNTSIVQMKHEHRLTRNDVSRLYVLSASKSDPERRTYRVTCQQTVKGWRRLRDALSAFWDYFAPTV